MRALLNDAAARAIRYVDELGERAVTPSPEAVARLCELDTPLPEEPQDPAAVLALTTTTSLPLPRTSHSS